MLLVFGKECSHWGKGTRLKTIPETLWILENGRERTNEMRNNWFENFQLQTKYVKIWKSASLAFILVNSPITYSHRHTICFTYLSPKVMCIWVLMWLMPMSSILPWAIRGEKLYRILHTIVTSASRTICGAHEYALTDRMKYL